MVTRSTSRLEYPHSLSYHAITFAIVPSITAVSFASTIDENGEWMMSVETIEELRAGRASLVLVSHLGRPNGKRDERLSMAPVAECLRTLTDGRVLLAPGG